MRSAFVDSFRAKLDRLNGRLVDDDINGLTDVGFTHVRAVEHAFYMDDLEFTELKSGSAKPIPIGLIRVKSVAPDIDADSLLHYENGKWIRGMNAGKFSQNQEHCIERFIRVVNWSN